jgi:FMN phosphatase YigB (HAD superfamily)
MEGQMPGVEAVLLDLYDTLVWADWTALRSGRDRLAARAGAEVPVAREQWAQTHDRRMRGLNRGLEGDLAAILEACGVAATPDAGYRLAIVSNASCEAGGVVSALGLDALVDAVILSCDVGWLKPEPAILQAALERLDVQTERALLVDDVAANLDAAASLGLRTALMARPGGRTTSPGGAAPGAEETPPAHHATIASLSELWQLLG